MKNRRTLGICDRCSLEFKLNTLRPQVVARKLTSTLVCRSCMDEDQPQWFPARIAFGDPAPVPNARPDTEKAVIFAGFGWGPVGGLGTNIRMGVTYDFDLQDNLISDGMYGLIVQEDGWVILQEDASTIMTETP